MKKQSFGRLVWRQFKRRKISVIALAIVVLLFAVAILAPVMANNKPIALKKDGKWYYPAVFY